MDDRRCRDPVGVTAIVPKSYDWVVQAVVVADDAQGSRAQEEIPVKYRPAAGSSPSQRTAKTSRKCLLEKTKRLHGFGDSRRRPAFKSSQTALFVGTSGTETIDFAASGKSGIDVTLGGVNEGVFTTSGPLLVFGQGGKDTVKEGGLKNSLYLLESPTADNVGADMDEESILWVGLTAAVEILNA